MCSVYILNFRLLYLMNYMNALKKIIAIETNTYLRIENIINIKA